MARLAVFLDPAAVRSLTWVLNQRIADNAAINNRQRTVKVQVASDPFNQMAFPIGSSNKKEYAVSFSVEEAEAADGPWGPQEFPHPARRETGIDGWKSRTKNAQRK